MIRKIIVLFFLYTLVEGALRKWFFPEASTELYAVKDVILGIGFIAFLATDLRRSLSVFTQAEIGVWLIWIAFILGFFLLRAPSFSSVVGLRYYLAPLPLLVLVPIAIQNGDQLLRAGVVLLALTIPICLLGVAQFMSPLDAEINRYAWTTSADDISGFAGFTDDRALGVDFDQPRITGTFSYISTYAAFLTAALMVAWTCLTLVRSPRAATVPAIALVMIFMNLAMTGSRAPVATSLVLSVPYLFFLFGRSRTNEAYGIFVSIVLVISVVAISAYGAIALDAVIYRAETGADTQERLRSAFLLPYLTFQNIDAFGLGIGATFGGLSELGMGDDVFGLFKETEEDRAGAELGYLGYGLMLIIKCAYLIKTLRLFSDCKGQNDLRIWTFGVLAVQLSSVWQVPFHNPVASSMYFASLGLFHWLRGELRRRQASEVQVKMHRKLALR